MAKALHALDYLAKPENYPPIGVCLVFGDEPFLRRQTLLRLRGVVLGGDEAEFSLTNFDGREAQFRDVVEELSTVAMFGGDRRLVIVEDADDFVSHYRPQLEDYVARPSRASVLVLDMKSCPSTTRLYKAVAEQGLVIDCGVGKSDRLPRWVADWARQIHKLDLPMNAADMLLEIIGPELGLIDQELAKLALMTPPGEKVTAQTVRQMVGGWRAKTTWDMLDAALDGNTAEAITQLDRLLAGGEDPIGLLGQIAGSLRRLAAATRLIVQAEQAGRRTSLDQALQQAGVKPFVLKKVERQLRRLGRQRGTQLYRWLLETDLDLKGESAMPRRLILERLIVRLASPSGAG